MRVLFLSLCCVFAPSFAQQDAKFLHLSPEIKAGPKWGTGITGAGVQLGAADVYKTNSLYLNVGQVSYDYLIDADEWQFYRLGVEHRLVKEPKIAFQLELGLLDYQGKRRYLSGTEEREAVGFSSAGSVVFNFNSNLGFRAGLDVNRINKSQTFLSTSSFMNLNSGVVLRF